MRRLVTTAAAIALGLGLTLATTGIASAQEETISQGNVKAAAPPGLPLPLAPFRVQDNYGRCANLNPDSAMPTWVFLDPSCDLLNLNEQLTYDAVTNQVVTLGTGYCLDVNLLSYISWQPCDSTKPGQRFWRTVPDSFGRSRILTIVGGSKFFLHSPPDEIRMFATTGAGVPPEELLFRFPLV